MHSTEKQRSGADRRHSLENNARGPSLAGARFLTTVAEWRQLPDSGEPEVAFAGRSNAGKSSAINALTQRTRLAFASKTPGRTRLINFFQLSSGGLLADLPGYGYAAVPAADRRRWQSLLARYLSTRPTLVGLVLVTDCRRPMTVLDRQMLDWFLPSGRPVRILLTKADKLTAQERVLAIGGARQLIAECYPLHLPQLATQLFSAAQAIGIAEAAEAIADWLTSAIAFRKHKKKGPGIKGSDTGPKTPCDR